ncbi:hypothetical protein MS3_00003384 [Schistosoma haematobium]|uniref:Neural proliferation differentiation and control protein 1 n=2 Tax=Schistosoma haematobium TaxID=6185 RepID=A0A922LUB1_SCHHA|nr:hypothetical protein MS3_00003384 [Schistosoma haematobium]KAH9594040.1 hypothetical protein MS3_00003384 [Schistosoma haematobium]CAH8437034.1 unnamed protein product [Schistosoma haematobium]
MTLLKIFKKELYYSLHIFIVYIIFGSKWIFCEIINGSVTDTKSSDHLIIWISTGLGISVAVLIIIVCCLLVLVCNLRSIKYDTEPAIFKEAIVNGNNCLPGDRVLATSAQRYHFSHQKQQMLAEHKFSVVPERGNSPPKVLYSDLKPAEKLEIENPGFIGPSENNDNHSSTASTNQSATQ